MERHIRLRGARGDESFLGALVASFVSVAVMGLGLGGSTATAEGLRQSSEGAAFRDPLAALHEERIEQQLAELGVSDLERPRRDAPARRGRWMYARPAPDMDGDGVPEAIERLERWRVVTNVQGVRLDTEVKTRVTVRSGATGEALWHKTFDTSAEGIGFRVGPDGRPGVLVIRHYLRTSSGAYTRTLAFDAFTGERGRFLWARSYPGTFSCTPASCVSLNVPMTIDRVDALPGKAEDLLLSLSTRTSTVTRSTTATRTLVIDGGTGQEVPHPTVDIGVNFWPAAGGTGDLDGDGLDDYVVANKPVVDPGGDQEPPTVGDGGAHARSGTTGLPIWTTSELPLGDWAFAYDLPNVARDRTPDVAIDSFGGGSRQFALDGASGDLLWHRPGSWLHAPGDIDGDGVADLVVSRWKTDWEQGILTVHQEALRGTGTGLWSRDSVWDFENLPCPGGLCVGSLYLQPEVSADVQGDGLLETFVDMGITQNIVISDRRSEVFDGKTGRRLLADDGLVDVAGGVSINARGSDFVRYELDGDDVRVVGLSGTGRTLWKTHLARPTRILPKDAGFFTFGSVLPGDRCGDVIANIFEGLDESSFYAVIDGGTGRVLWSRSAGPKEDRLHFVRTQDRNQDC